MKKRSDPPTEEPSKLITATLWLLSVSLFFTGCLALWGATASADPTLTGITLSLSVATTGLLLGVWARRRRATKEESLAQWDPGQAREPEFTWDGTDSPEALEAAFRSNEVPVLPDGTPPGPLPPHVAGALPVGAEYLGGFLRSYPRNRAGLVRAIIMFLVFGGLAAVCIELPNSRPPAPGEEKLVFGVFYGIAATCAFMGLTILWSAIASPGRTFHLFEDGLVEVIRGKSRAIAFSQIEECKEINEFKFLTLHEIHRMWFELTEKGDRIEIDTDTTSNAAELGEFIQTRVFERLLPQTVDAISAGLKLSWGPVTMDSHGISFGFRGTYRWDRIRSLGIARLGGKVVVNAGRFPKGTGVRADSIPNYQLLFRVSERLCSGS